MLKRLIKTLIAAGFIGFAPTAVLAHTLGGQEHHHRLRCHSHYHHGGHHK